jgi:hypothetical protein
MGAWAVVAMVALEEVLEKKRKHKRQPLVADLELKIERLERELKETRKGANEFGRICP